MKQCIEAGALIRRDVRRFLLENNINFTEEKGWIDSVFYLHCSPETYLKITETLKPKL